MPGKFDRCVLDVLKSGKSQDSAYAICTASVGRPGTKSKPKPKSSK